MPRYVIISTAFRSITNAAAAAARTARAEAAAAAKSAAAAAASGGGGGSAGLNRSILIVELPAEILVKILNYMSFKEISQVRLVSNLLEVSKQIGLSPRAVSWIIFWFVQCSQISLYGT